MQGDDCSRFTSFSFHIDGCCMTANWAITWKLDDFVFIIATEVDAFIKIVWKPIITGHGALAVTATVEGEGVKEL